MSFLSIWQGYHEVAVYHAALSYDLRKDKTRSLANNLTQELIQTSSLIFTQGVIITLVFDYNSNMDLS